MKTLFLALAGCLIVAASGFAQADCVGKTCRVAVAKKACNPFESDCQCSDPICNKPMFSNCMSRLYCCMAFGNIGMR